MNIIKGGKEVSDALKLEHPWQKISKKNLQQIQTRGNKEEEKRQDTTDTKQVH